MAIGLGIGHLPARIGALAGKKQAAQKSSGIATFQAGSGFL
jgi:hypothetical protein